MEELPKGEDVLDDFGTVKLGSSSPGGDPYSASHEREPRWLAKQGACAKPGRAWAVRQPSSNQKKKLISRNQVQIDSYLDAKSTHTWWTAVQTMAWL